MITIADSYTIIKMIVLLLNNYTEHVTVMSSVIIGTQFLVYSPTLIVALIRKCIATLVILLCTNSNGDVKVAEDDCHTKFNICF